MSDATILLVALDAIEKVLEVGEKLSLNFWTSTVESKIYKSTPTKKKSIRWRSKSWETFIL